MRVLIALRLLHHFVIQTTKGRKNLGNIHKYIYEDALEILRFALTSC